MEKVSDKIYSLGDTIEGKVIAVDRSTVYIDLAPIGTGIVYGREFSQAKDVLRNIKIGDVISANIIQLETEEGYIDLSLKEARKQRTWDEAEQAIIDKRPFDVMVKSANRGGLVVEWQGIRGFLPASQLTQENYPKAINGDKDTVLTELKKFIDKKITVTIENIDTENDTIIFSEHKGSVNDEKGGSTLR